MRAMSPQISGVPIVCSTVCSGEDLRKHQSSASLSFVRGIQRWSVDSPQEGSATTENLSIWLRHQDILAKLHMVLWFVVQCYCFYSKLYPYSWQLLRCYEGNPKIPLQLWSKCKGYEYIYRVYPMPTLWHGNIFRIALLSNLSLSLRSPSQKACNAKLANWVVGVLRHYFNDYGLNKHNKYAI